MAYNQKNLSVLAYANGFTMWHYSTNDQPSDMAANENGYFNKASDMLLTGDMIICNAGTGTANAQTGILVVAEAIKGGAVTVAKM